MFLSNPIGNASKLSLKFKKWNCQENGDFWTKRLCRNSIKTFSKTYFGPTFFKWKKIVAGVTRYFYFFESYWKCLKIEFDVEKNKIVKKMEISEKIHFFQNSIKTFSHTYFGKIASSLTGYVFQIFLEVPKNWVWSRKTKLSSWNPIIMQSEL